MSKKSITKILILTSTDFESDSSLNSNRRFNVTIKKVGVGPTFSVLNSYQYIEKIDPDLIINSGIGGSFNRSDKIGTVVNITEDILENSKALEDEILPLSFDSNYFKEYMIKSYFDRVLDLPNRRGITVSLVSGNRDLALRRKKVYNAEIESMEGFAIMLAAKRFKIPIMQIRSISNYTGDEKITKENLFYSIKMLNNKIKQILEEQSFE